MDYEFQCESGHCIPLHFLCDGEYDCGPGDYSDENNENCEGISLQALPTNTNVLYCNVLHTCVLIFSFFPENECLGLDFFRCSNDVCLPSYTQCDFVDDCGDGSDELNCSMLHRIEST